MPADPWTRPASEQPATKAAAAGAVGAPSSGAAPESARPSKRRPGPAMGGLPVADPRPVLAGGAVLGCRCTACRYPVAQRGLPWCPACYAAVADAEFTAAGTAWSATVVAIPVGALRPPFGLAYLDLDDGPRVLVRLAGPEVVPPGTRLVITGTDRGDLIAAREEQA